MLCKKCKTATQIDTEKNDRNCSYCGMRLPNKKMRILVSALSCVLILCLGSFYVYLLSTDLLPSFFVNEIANVEINNGIASDKEINIADLEEQPDNGEFIANEFLEIKEPSLTANQQSSEMKQMWDMLESVNASVQQYRSTNGATTTFISKEGYLYDYSNENFISQKTIYDAGLLEEEYLNTKVLLLFLKPSDFADYKEVDFDYSSDLQLFTGYEISSGIAVYSKENSGIVFREHFNEIIAHYKVEDSEIETPLSNTIDYENVVKTIISNEMDDVGYDVRLLKMDSKYAVIVFSYETDPTVLHGYLLRRIDGGFSIILRRFEQFTQYLEKINNVASNINLEMIPKIEIGQFKLYSSKHYDMDDIIGELTNKMLVTEEELPVKYLCGTDEFIYLQLSSLKRFLGAYNSQDKKWEFKEMQNSEEALKTLNSLSYSKIKGEKIIPPWVIIKQD